VPNRPNYENASTVTILGWGSGIGDHAAHLQYFLGKRHPVRTLEVEKRQEDQEKLEGEKKDIAFGSQIRSYVMQPYQMIKDLRTGYEVGDVQRVLDGDLNGFIEAYLTQRARGTAA